MASRVELPVEDLKAALQQMAKIQYRAERNAASPEVAKIYKQLGDHFSRAMQTVLQIK